MSDTPISTRSVPKRITLEMKHDFLAIVLADPRSRNKRRPMLTAFDGAVLSVLVTHVNAERGYSFIGVRAIANKLRASPAGVAKSITKLRDLDILVEVAGARMNRAARWAPNWYAFLDPNVHDKAVDSVVHGHGEDITVHADAENGVSTDMTVDETVRKRTRKGANGTGRASLARAAASPKGLGDGRRSARPNKGKKSMKADDLLSRWKDRRSAEDN